MRLTVSHNLIASLFRVRVVIPPLYIWVTIFPSYYNVLLVQWWIFTYKLNTLPPCWHAWVRHRSHSSSASVHPVQSVMSWRLTHSLNIDLESSARDHGESMSSSQYSVGISEQMDDISSQVIITYWNLNKMYACLIPIGQLTEPLSQKGLQSLVSVSLLGQPDMGMPVPGYFESDSGSRHVLLRNLVVGSNVHSPVQSAHDVHSDQPSEMTKMIF